MTSLKQIMSDHPFTKDFQAHHLDYLSRCANTAHVQSGQYIFHEGEAANRFYLLQKGGVVLETRKSGGEPAGIQHLEGGDALGWSWLIPPHLWRFDARVEIPTDLIVLDGSCLQTQCASDPEFGFMLVQQLAEMIGVRLEVTRIQLALKDS